jgi:hypothetical protein
VLAARGLVEKYVDAAEVRFVVAGLFTAAVDAVLVAHHLPIIVAHLITTRLLKK